MSMPVPTCPLCQDAQRMEQDADYGDFACPRCGLAGPPGVIERVAKLVERGDGSIGGRVLDREEAALCVEALRNHASFVAGETRGEMPEHARAMWELARKLRGST